MAGAFTKALRDPIVAIAAACEIGAVERRTAAAAVGRSRRVVSLADDVLRAQLAEVGKLAARIEERDPRSALDLRGLAYACTMARLEDLTAVAAVEQPAAARVDAWRDLARTRSFFLAIRLTQAGANGETARPVFAGAVDAALRVLRAHPEREAELTRPILFASLMATAWDRVARLPGDDPTVLREAAYLWQDRERLAQVPHVPLSTALSPLPEEATLWVFLRSLCATADAAEDVADHEAAVAAVPAVEFGLIRRLLTDVADVDPDRAVALAERYRAAMHRIFPAASPWSAAADEGFGTVVVRAATVADADGKRYPLSEAGAALRAAAAAFGEGADAARAVGFAAKAHRRAGDLAAARADAEDAVRFLTALPPSPDRDDNLQTAQSDLALVLRESGDDEAALAAFAELYAELCAKGSTQAAEHRRAIAARHIVSLCIALGRIDEAIDMAGAALRLLQHVPQPATAARTALDVARLALEWGRPELFDTAVEHAEHVLAAVGPRAESDPRWLAVRSDVAHLQAALLLGYSTEADLQTDDLDRSAELLAVARDAAQRAGDPVRYASAVLETAWCAELRKRPHEVLKWVARVDIEAVPAARPFVLLRRAAALAATGGDPEPSLTDAIELFEQSRAVREEAATWCELGRVRLGRDDDGAMAAYERAEALVRLLRDGLVTDSGRIGLQGVFAGSYADVLRHLAQRPGASQETWTWVQRAKSRTLVELVGLDPRPPAATAAHDERTRALLAEEADLLATLRTTRVARSEWPAPDGAAPAARAAEVERRLRALWRELAATMPEYTAVRLADEVTAADVVAAL